MPESAGFKLIRPGVFEPQGYERPSRPIDDMRLKELVEQILSSNDEPESVDQTKDKNVSPAIANPSKK